MNRNQAIKTLQVSLKDFRRMCILKGIYPRDPKHKSKLAKGSSSLNKTYYHTKDIKQLVYDPLLSTLRKYKTFGKKMRRFKARGEWEMAKRFESLHAPKLPYPDILKSKYPTFIDALRDLDDALTHISLFTSLPTNTITSFNSEILKSCYRLLGEFSRYIMETHSLRYVFVSIKGTYLQAEVHGQTITWVIPHAFNLELPLDIDIRVMTTFLELYHSLVSFINFRLFKEIGWGYPSIVMDEDNSPNSKNASTGIMSISNPITTLALTNSSVIIEESSEIVDQFESPDKNTSEGKLEDPTLIGNAEEDIITSLIQRNDEKKKVTSLFNNAVFFLSREVPFDVLVLCITSFGGRVGWNHGPGSPFSEDDTRITHHVVDRPVLLNMFASRKYVQPQWIFDSINSRKLLSEELYGPTVKDLPPHLSPFVEESDDEDQSSDQEVSATVSDETEVKQDPDQIRELALSMMSKKKRKLYEAMQRGIRNKQTEKNRLATRRSQVSGKDPQPNSI